VELQHLSFLQDLSCFTAAFSLQQAGTSVWQQLAVFTAVFSFSQVVFKKKEDVPSPAQLQKWW
jgi:hypothetical protein